VLIYDPVFWLLAITGVIFTGISKSGFAGGAGVVAVPLLALNIPVTQAAALMLPLLLLMDAKALLLYRKNIELNVLKQLLPAALLGIAAGGFLMGTFSEHLLRWLLGIFCIAFALWQPLIRVLKRAPAAAWLWGGLSGLTSTLLHAGGPPISIYFLSQKTDKIKWLAGATVFFAAMNLIKLIPYTINGQWNDKLLLIDLILIPFAVIGIQLGYKIQHTISEKQFINISKGLLFLSGSALIYSNI